MKEKGYLFEHTMTQSYAKFGDGGEFPMAMYALGREVVALDGGKVERVDEGEMRFVINEQVFAVVTGNKISFATGENTEIITDDVLVYDEDGVVAAEIDWHCQSYAEMYEQAFTLSSVISKFVEKDTWDVLKARMYSGLEEELHSEIIEKRYSTVEDMF